VYHYRGTADLPPPSPRPPLEYPDGDALPPELLLEPESLDELNDVFRDRRFVQRDERAAIDRHYRAGFGQNRFDGARRHFAARWGQRRLACRRSGDRQLSTASSQATAAIGGLSA
jgi:hypothetical protein